MKPVTYRVTHETRYTYSQRVAGSSHLAHLTPRATAWQRVHEHRIVHDPVPGEAEHGRDYFGNAVTRFHIEVPHLALTVRAESVVEVEPRNVDCNASPPWESARADADAPPQHGLEVEEFRAPSPMAPRLDAARAYAAPSFPAGRPWLEALLDLTQRIKRDFAYDPTATTVTTRVAEVLTLGRGVCQDFAHLMISCLRSLGLPARYVSGYVLTSTPARTTGLVGADASHAWIAAHCPGLGWVAFDPTNGKIADSEFVTVAWGREFSDVTPLRGVVLSAATQTLAVAVSVVPAAPPTA